MKSIIIDIESSMNNVITGLSSKAQIQSTLSNIVIVDDVSRRDICASDEVSGPLAEMINNL